MNDVAPPIVDGRTEAEMLASLRVRVPGYLPGWQPAPGSPADAVDQLLAGYAAIVARASNAALERAQLAFLDACGESRRPPQAAGVTLVFTLADQSPVDAPLPPGMGVAAQPTPGATADPPTFVVTQPIALARAKLAALYSVDPLNDRWDDHTPLLAQGFTLFEGVGVVEHALYLGHDTVFKLPAGDAKVIVQTALVHAQMPVREDLRLQWEYWSDTGWRPFEGAIVDRLITDQQADLRKEGGPASGARELFGQRSYWIRAQLVDPLPTAGAPKDTSLPVVDSVRVSVDVGRENLVAEAVAIDGRLVDANAPFQPFGATPVRGTTFYLGSTEAFGRPGAKVRVQITFTGACAVATGPITFEYFTGETWKPIAVSDTTHVFAAPLATMPPAEAVDGVLSFVAPADWRPFTVGRTSAHFLRARLDGDTVFGKDAYFENGTFHPAAWIPPRIASLRISFSQITPPLFVDHCLLSNGGVLADVTQAARSIQRTFQPFLPLEDQQPAVYLGFDLALPRGLVSLFVNVPPNPDIAPPDNSSPFVWEYLSTSPRGWMDLGAQDGTLGFRTSGFIQFIGPFDHKASDGPGGSLYRIRARLKPGVRLPTRPIGGVWLNAVLATQASSYEGETLGRGTGEPRQLIAFSKARTPILDDERIEVREWTGRDRGYEAITETVTDADRREVVDPLTGQIVEVWVRWRARPHLFDAGSDDRVYTLDKVAGLLRFGDGQRGMVPPEGAPIAVTFRTGGGLVGNVPSGTVTEPRAAIPFLGSVTNPHPASGGSDVESPDTTRLRGAQRLRHGGRALAPSDFEWLAVEASPAVARARCLPVTGAAGNVQRGWITVVIVPQSQEHQPQPDEELIARVRAYLRDRAPAAVANRIRVMGPQYLPVSVIAEIVPIRPEEASTVESALRRRLDDFLHPLRGGRDGRAWQVGQGVPLSQVAALIEGTPGVDFARAVSVRVEGAAYHDEVPGRPEQLVAPGDHELRVTLRGEAC